MLFLDSSRSHPLCTTFDLKVSGQPTVTPARVLDTPTATFGNGTVSLQRGSWNTPNFFSTGSTNQAIQWAIVCVPGDKVRTYCF